MSTISALPQTARDYQIELFEKAVEENVIIWLETGTGKTYIAILLIKELSYQIVKPYGSCEEQGKRTIFVVNNVSLAKQQAEYIKKHTSLKAKYFIGDMSVDLWSAKQWIEELNSCQVLVMTAQIVSDMLNHSYLSLFNVNLLVFDECHHAKKKHPYQIIMNHYADLKKQTKEKEQGRTLPKVLGLTACIYSTSIKSEIQMHNRLKSLELTYFAKIATTTYDTAQYAALPNEELILANEHRPIELLSSPNWIRFSKQVNDLHFTDANGGGFNVDDFDFDNAANDNLKTFEGDLKDCYEFLGLTGLKMFLNHHENKLNGRDLQRGSRNPNLVSSKVVPKLKELSTSLDLLLTHSETTDKSMNMAPKVAKLKQMLKSICRLFEEDKRQFCGIIFVQRRYSAAILTEIITEWAQKDMTLQKLKPTFLTGNVTATGGSVLARKKDHSESLASFRNGKSNLLVATNVVEEGIDVPQCNFVCKFDLPQDFRSYIQSRGRARAKNSYYFMLADENEWESFHEKLHSVFKAIEKFINNQCSNRSTPSDSECFNQHYLLNEEVLQPYKPFDHPDSPRVMPSSALSLLNKYCQTLPSDQFSLPRPIFTIEELCETSFEATLRLPTSSAVKHVIKGLPQSSKQNAKVSAALIACKLLHEKGELNDKLLPRLMGSESKQLKKTKTDREGKVLAFQRKYLAPFNRKLTSFHSFYRYSIIHTVLDHVWICKKTAQFVKDPQFKLGFLAPDLWPVLPKFLIYSLYGTEIVVVKHEDRVTLTLSQIESLIQTNGWIYKTILKIPNVRSEPSTSPFQLITIFMDNSLNFMYKYNLEKLAEENDWCEAVVKITKSNDDIKDRLNIVERVIFKKLKRYLVVRPIGKSILYTTKERTKLSDCRPEYPMDECTRECYPAEILYHSMCLPAVLERISSLVNSENFIREMMSIVHEHSFNWALTFENAREYVLNMVECTLVPSFYNLEDRSSLMSFFKNTKQFLQYFDLQDIGPLVNDVLKCFTLKSAHSGDGLNLEQFEVYGDAFLKFSVTRYLFCSYPELNEGDLTRHKSSIISNSNLAEKAISKGIEGLIVSRTHRARENWLPPLFVPVSTSEPSVLTHNVFKEKSLADVVEALLGCILSTCSMELALRFLNNFFDIKVLPEGSQKFQVPSPRQPLVENQINERNCQVLLSGVDVVEKALQYVFRDKMLLVQALTHSSYTRNTITDSYQRLEFLGDALIDFLVTRHIFTNNPDMDPGKLTDMRSALVNNVLFSSLSVKLGLHKSLKYMSIELHREINKFVDFVTTPLSDSSEKSDEVRIVNFSDMIKSDINSDVDNSEDDEDVIDDPKPLGDVLEAIAAAVYLDCDFSLETVWHIFYPIMKESIEKYSLNIPLMPVRELYEMFPLSVMFLEKEEEEENLENDKRGDCFTTDDQSGDVTTNRCWRRLKTMRVLVKTIEKVHEFEGKGSTLKCAKRRAAKKAVDYFKNNGSSLHNEIADFEALS